MISCTIQRDFLLAAATATFMAAAASAQVTLVKDGQPQATIYVDQPWKVQKELSAVEFRRLKPDERETYTRTQHRGAMVEDLVLHVRLITGAEMPVVQVDRAGDIKGPGIVVGAPAVELGAAPLHQTVMQESIRLLTKGDLVLIGGEGELSYRHGVYELLRTLGCDWIMPGDEGIITPQADTLIVPRLDIARKPAFEIRAPWYSGGARIVDADDYARFNRWKIRQQQTLEARDHPEFIFGGHMWNSLLLRYKKELQENPELYAQVRKPDGTLGPGHAQLDPTQPRILEMTIEYIRDTFKRQGWPNDRKMTFSVGPNDGLGFSESPAALAKGSGRIDPLTGDRDQTDIFVWYANTLQEMVKEEFPNLRLGWLIYSAHSDYPMIFRPNPQFVGHFADITQSRFHSLLDGRSPSRTYYRRVLEQWARLTKEQGNPLWYYGYNWNLAENMLPYSKMKIWGQDLPYYHAMGVKGHNNEQDKAWAILGPHNYLMARMGWDIDLDWRKVLDQYCAMAFGKAGPAMVQYYLMLIDAQETAGSEAGAYGSLHLVFTDDFLVRAQQQLDAAARAADTPYHQKMVDYFSQPLQAAKIYSAFRKALLDFNYVEAQKQYDAMVTQWDATLAKNPDLVSRYGRRYLDWLFKPMVAMGVQYSTGDYRIHYRLPDEMPVALDPHNNGAELGLQNPEVSDRRWLRLKTYSSSFAEQGMQFFGLGGLWYRTTFTGPKADQLADGKGVGLYVGSVEDEVRVFINGRYVGLGRGFVRPFAFDLTEHIKAGEPNLLALQVIRNSGANEIGRGGILYPCYVFTGPRLEKPAPNNDPLYRVLPGGATDSITK